MKYIILLGDGMADEPIPELGGLTPLEHAHTPNMDALAAAGEIGRVETIPPGFHPGSDVANLSVFGYDPAGCYTGRAPLEAASMGVTLAPEDVAFRLNLVTLRPHFGRLYMEEFTAGHISTGEAQELIEHLQEELGDERFEFHPGVSYRHLMVWRGGKDALEFVPPHDITGQSVEGHLPRGEGAEELLRLTNSAQMLLHRHPLNALRQRQGKPPANSIWLWGHGRAPAMPTLQQRFGLRGAVISAVDLIKGIGVYAGLDVIKVPGATGYIDTNYRGKAEYALEALKTRDFVYLHVEAPDEAAHAGNLEHKLMAIEDFDALVVGTVMKGLPALGEHRVLVLPDHPTPVRRRTHTSDAVPYALYGSQGEYGAAGPQVRYSERMALAAGLLLPQGHQLFGRLIHGRRG